MPRGTNFEHTRAYNRRAILHTLRLREKASRTELARQTSLSLQAVSNIVRDLVDEGLVKATGRRSTQRGQPPLEFVLNRDGAYSLGLALDRDHLSGLVVDMLGMPVARTRVEMDTSDPEHALAHASTLAEELVAHLPHGHADRVIGTALGVPGVVERDGGRITRMVRLPRWEGLRVADMDEVAWLPPLHVANDAVLAGLGERWFGEARHIDTFFYLLYALGFGSSLVFEGDPYGGPWGHQGRLGHIPVEPGGLECPACGGTGCLSLYTSLAALHDHLAAHGVEARTPEELTRAFEAGEPALMTWIDTAAHYLHRALVVLENLLAPDALVFGGRMPSPILDALIFSVEELHRNSGVRLRSRSPRLIRSRDDLDVVALGAAALPHYLATAPRHDLVATT